MKKLIMIALVAVVLFFSALAHAQNISYLGSTLWSGVCDVKIQGNYAYCAFFNGLMVLDIANPDTPRFALSTQSSALSTYKCVGPRVR